MGKAVGKVMIPIDPVCGMRIDPAVIAISAEAL